MRANHRAALAGLVRMTTDAAASMTIGRVHWLQGLMAYYAPCRCINPSTRTNRVQMAYMPRALIPCHTPKHLQTRLV